MRDIHVQCTHGRDRKRLKIFTDPNFLFHILLIASVFAGVDGLPASDFTLGRKQVKKDDPKKGIFPSGIHSILAMGQFINNCGTIEFILTFEGLDVVSSVSEESRSSMDFAWQIYTQCE